MTKEELQDRISYLERTLQRKAEQVASDERAITKSEGEVDKYELAAANAKPHYKMVNGKRTYQKAVPVYLQAVANLCNQLFRSGTSIGANNAEATNAVSRQDFRSKSYIALKEARESLYWIELLHRNSYIDDKQFCSIYADCEELVKILVARCKKLDQELNGSK